MRQGIRMSIRRAVMMTVATLTIGGGAVLPTSVASAVEGYPPGPCTSTTGTQTLGTFNIGDAFNIRFAPVCTWTPGTTVNVSVNGQANVTTPVVDNSGGATIQVRLLSTTVMEINPQVPAVCGTNTLVATGASTGTTGPVTQTVTFVNSCAAPGTKTGGVALTGSDVAVPSAVALAAVMAGSVLVVAARRRRAGAPA